MGFDESGVGVRDDVRAPLEPSPRFLRRDRERPHIYALVVGDCNDGNEDDELI